MPAIQQTMSLRGTLKKAVILTASAAALSACSNAAPIASFSLDGQIFNLEVAADQAAHLQGLMKRRSIPRNGGMIFTYSEPQRLAFWMKDTLIPLDIIYLDQHMRVTNIYAEVPPCRIQRCPNYGSDGDAQYVIELKAGTAAQVGLKPGDVVHSVRGAS